MQSEASDMKCLYRYVYRYDFLTWLDQYDLENVEMFHQNAVWNMTTEISQHVSKALPPLKTGAVFLSK